MQYLVYRTIIGITLILLTAFSAVANPLSLKSDYYNPLDLKLEFGLNGGYTSNLLTINDSSDVEDSYTTSSVKLIFYPVSSMEVILFGDYTYYSQQYNLNSLSKGIAFTFIPTKEHSQFSAYLSGGFSGQTYKDNLNAYNNNNFNLLASLGYNLSRTFSLRTGMLLESNSYLYSDVSDNDSYEIFAGTNFTLFGSNSIDIEGGYSSKKFSYIPDTTGRMDLGLTGSFDVYHTRGDLNSFYLSPRFSRPIGSKTGLNLTFHHREFLNADNAVVLGSAVNFISPWGNIFEGQSYTISLKTIIIPKMIISSGLGYWKKAFLKTMVITDYAIRFAEKRYDEQNRFFVILERPIYFKSGGALKPKLQIDLTHNNTTTRSMFNYYDYSGFSINASLTYEL